MELAFQQLKMHHGSTNTKKRHLFEELPFKPHTVLVVARTVKESEEANTKQMKIKIQSLKTKQNIEKNSFGYSLRLFSVLLVHSTSQNLFVISNKLAN